MGREEITRLNAMPSPVSNPAAKPMKSTVPESSAATRSNPIYFLENGPKCWKGYGVTAGCCEAKVAAENRPDVLTRARAYAAATPVAISGSGGSDQTYSLACSLVNGFALDENTALTILREWNAGCKPPWKERDLRHKVSDALKENHTKPRGHLLGNGLPAFHKPVCVALPPERAVWKVQRRKVAEPSAPPLAKTPSIQPASLEEDGLVRVPGCKVPRPVEIEVDDDTWRAVEAAGFVEEPLIQHALWLFPGSTVVESGVA